MSNPVLNYDASSISLLFEQIRAGRLLLESNIASINIDTGNQGYTSQVYQHLLNMGEIASRYEDYLSTLLASLKSGKVSLEDESVVTILNKALPMIQLAVENLTNINNSLLEV